MRGSTIDLTKKNSGFLKDETESENETVDLGSSQKRLVSEDINEDIKKLEQLNNLLEKSKQSSAKILEILDGVQERVADVEAGIAPIYKVTSLMKTTNTNISSAVDAMDHVFSYFYLEAEINKVITVDGPAKDLETYLDVLQKLDETIIFFEKNKGYKSSQNTLKQLLKLKTLSVSSCEKLYSQLLEQCSAPLDPNTFPMPLPKKMELVKQAQKRELALLSSVLSNSAVLVRDYGEFRGKFFLGTMKKHNAAQKKVAQKKGEFLKHADNSHLTQSRLEMSSSVTSANSSSNLYGSIDEDLGKSFGEFTMCLLRVAEHERRLAEAVLGDNRFAKAYGVVIEGPFELFSRLAEVWNQRKRNFLFSEICFFFSRDF